MKFAIISAFVITITQVLARPAPGCLQNYTVVATDTCVSVAARFGLAEIDFYNMNPGLHHNPAHNCDNLDDGKPFCVCMKAPCAMPVMPAMSAMSAPSSSVSSLQPSPAYMSASPLPSFSNMGGYRSVLLSPSGSISPHSIMPAMSASPGAAIAAIPSFHANLNNMISPSISTPTNTLRTSGTTTGVNAQASHFANVSGASCLYLKTAFGTMTASFIIVSTLLSL